MTGRRIVVGTDTDDPSVRATVDHLRALGHEVHQVAAGQDWPEVAQSVGREVASGVADLGVVWCWTGTGVSIAANKLPGVRAALCHDAATAAGARRWNDANVLALSVRATSAELCREIVDAFLEGSLDPSEAPAVARLEP